MPLAWTKSMFLAEVEKIEKAEPPLKRLARQLFEGGITELQLMEWAKEVTHKHLPSWHGGLRLRSSEHVRIELAGYYREIRDAHERLKSGSGQSVRKVRKK